MNQRRSRRNTRAQQQAHAASTPARRKESPRPNAFLVALVALAAIAAIFSVVGAALVLRDIANLSERARLVLTLPDADRAPAGEAAILDGRVADSEPARYKEFVVYLRKQEQGGGKYSVRRDAIVDRATPAFAVEIAGHIYQIANDDYSFDDVTDAWADARREDEAPTALRSAITVEGLTARSPVMAIGRLMSANAGAPAFHAESVVGLSRADYLERLDASKASRWRLAIVLALLAPILASLAWRGGRRIMV
jgi:hypothetical protein